MKSIYSVILFLLFISCEKETEWDLEVGNKSQLVVEGTLTNEYKKQSIKLSYVMNTAEMGAIPATGAKVSVKGAIQTFTFTETPAGSGNYVSDKVFAAVVKVNYVLTVEIGGQVYTATAVMVPVTSLSPLSFSKKSDYDSIYNISYIAGFLEQENPAMYEVFIDWSGLLEYSSKDPDSCKALLYYYSLPTIDVSQAFAPKPETIEFPVGAIIKERKYSLSKQHAEFLRSMLFETSWRGGYFDEAQANVRTNISNGGMGFFGVCAVLETSVIVK